MTTRPTTPDDDAALFARVCAFDADRDACADALVARGEAAVPFLVGQMDDPQQGWQAIRLLGLIGAPASSCAEALHHRLWHATTEPGRAWPARALAQIGRLDLVLPLFDVEMPSLHPPPAYPTGAYCLVSALLMLRPASYDHLDRCARGPQGDTLRSIMMPGSASWAVGVDDVDACAAAFSRCGPEVRRDVIASVSQVPAAGRKAATALLVAAGVDVDADVRRLAAWGLRNMGKRHARPHVALLQSLQHDDHDAGVRNAADTVLRWLG